MKWNEIRIGSCNEGVSPKVKKAYAAIEARVNKLGQQRASFDAKVREAKGAALSPELVRSLEDVRTSKIVTWQTELEIRNELDAWFETYLESLAAIGDRAFKAIAETEEKIIESLESIGYVRMPATEMGAGKITQGMVNSHPSRIEAVRVETDLRDEREQARINSRVNREAMQATVQDMNRVRDSIAAVA